MSTASTYNIDTFLLNTGDNFYWCGIQNTSDFQINADFVKPYDELNLPFYSILGNHEYGYNVSAQLDYANMNPKWIMDDRYYTRRFELVTSAGTTAYASIIFLDTSPCLTGYRSSNSANWDPCSSKYPTCSFDSTDDDFEGECQFNANINSQNCQTQYDWFVSALAAVPADDWLIVMGHHPLDEVNFVDFVAPLVSHGFGIYINGHSHTLAQYTIDKAGAWVTTGAGSMVDTTDQLSYNTAKKVRGENIDVEDMRNAPEGMSTTHTYQTVFNSYTAGFTMHEFNSDFSQLTTSFVSYTGSVLHSFVVNKDGSLV